MILVSILVPFFRLKCSGFFLHSIAALFYHSSSLTVIENVRCVKSLVLYCLECSQNTDITFFISKTFLEA